MATFRIRSSNASSPTILAPHLPVTDKLPNGQRYTISLLFPSSLTLQSQDVFYRLLDHNMRNLQSNSSFPYTEMSKKEEMFDPTSRFLLALGETPMDTNDELATRTQQKQQIDIQEHELLGFCEFRFDVEDTLSDKLAEVVYCYELQLRPSVQKQGMARKLIGILEDIGRLRKMEKIMLTCLKNNASALSFYRHQGFETDEIDPTRMSKEEPENGEEVDYVILSKPL
ncbi:hypothetical protein C343_02987 [Cryptococcus neoformans C23]|uniref:N-alpha-acetyltransferase 40 n=2 Tax=Cryptococcus neoformans TaxID=5207 RepID=A0A854QET9_CRYNE|nr:hypothetical protein CNAG_01247 [Cryptococcus neoformans var. grubii H99]AUB24628.1 hypothetical protein CKF44_01247 [Cryptococcus neoformans var. grubii]OWZ32353.1 hypothetical protein C347_03050 [Cryptococcus neoformans var. grubii AD2-60a]OWZ44200.1 hypothetical protein C343_02987 [Cryptococcus neoformans var. grubii C23]OWZ44633.1 hypothetical protein C353_02890 [Cryptococcus neoformans var. grubii AD1-83a]OWZ57783.1 hypothetical protein C368_00951 [Cryptococcus neoformans var. grubii 1|eukprot:XP_012049009.1 hypothetical protein CNAG_01247 [Cryptococcus neoformans var. grubii H99]